MNILKIISTLLRLGVAYPAHFLLFYQRIKVNPWYFATSRDFIPVEIGRPGRLLNVLYTFNLRTVSTGIRITFVWKLSPYTQYVSSWDYFINSLMPGTTKRSHIFKETCSFQVQVCLSMCDLLLCTRQKRVNKRFGHKKFENV